jgi:phage baseplate assembly protein V
VNQLTEAAEKLWRRVQLVIGRGKVTTGRDDGNVQYLQIQLGENEIRDNTPRLAEYGFASMPTNGSDAIVIFVGGDRSNGVIIATGNQAERIRNLKPGESEMYDNLGKHIYLKATGIEIEAGGQPVTVNNATIVTVKAATKIRAETPLFECTGDIIDNAGTNTHSMAQMRTIYDGHNHIVRGVQGGGAAVTSDAPAQQE